MPALLAERWLHQARASSPLYADWPLADWLHGRDAFRAFVSQEWQQYIIHQSGGQGRRELGESKPSYRLQFDEDEQLQDNLPRLVRSGAVQPVMLAEAGGLPAWVQVGVRSSPADFAQQRADALLSLLDEQLAGALEGRWQQWQPIARTWAEWSRWRYHPERFLTDAQRAAYGERQGKLDAAFRRWLEQRYAPLSGQVIPRPHHLFHVPQFIAYERRRQTQPVRVALLVLDGLSLAAWELIASVWRARRPEWQWQEQLLLAQTPAITAVSRQALISGLRPSEFAASLTHNRQESKQWASFWVRENLAASACAYEQLKPGASDSVPDLVSSSRLQAFCLVYNGIDELVHGARLGLADFYASLYAWLKSELCRRLENVIAELLAHRYTLYITSDHGHTEAWGMGQPAEGLTVQTRSKRARIYRNYNAARAVQTAYPQTVLWQDQGLLPPDTWILMPQDENGRRLAFAPEGERVVTHGGLTIDEMVVPLARLTL
jgi:hypothetical protein